MPPVGTKENQIEVTNVGRVNEQKNKMADTGHQSVRVQQVKEIKSYKQVKWGPTDRRTDRAGCKVACTRLKILIETPPKQ